MPATSRRADRFEDAYRHHFEETGTLMPSFEEVRPAYQFGRGAALAPATTGERFEDVEAKIRARFEVEHPDLSYGAVQEAVRYGYERASRLKPAASNASLDAADDALPEWDRTLFQHGDRGETNVTSRNMAIRTPQTHTSSDDGGAGA